MLRPVSQHLCAAVANQSTFFYQVSMVGALPSGFDVPWRSSALLQEATSGPGGTDISGGWLAGGLLPARQCFWARIAGLSIP